MTALPQPPTHLLTVAEYAQLGETTTGYTELQEGNLIMSPSSSPRHMIASGRLLLQVQSPLPDDLCAVQEVDIDLELAPADQPGVVRRPDLVVVDYKAINRVDRDGCSGPATSSSWRSSHLVRDVSTTSSSETSTPTPASGTTGSWTSMSR